MEKRTCIEPGRRKRGAPKGNQNARKHGCYSAIITEKEKQALAYLPRFTADDAEIILLSQRLRSLLEYDAARIRLIVRTFRRIALFMYHRSQFISEADAQKVLADLFISLWHDLEKIANGQPLS